MASLKFHMYWMRELVIYENHESPWMIPVCSPEFSEKKKIVSIWIQLIPFQKSNWDSMVAIYHLFWHLSSIILSKITLIPFYSIPSLWIGFVGGKFQTLPFCWKPETECVNNFSKGSQWITPPYIHAIVSSLHGLGLTMCLI